ncbi:helix-turn-helix transcriptional regulator [Tetragenococcus halophilus]|uniref:helix-turn-helix domain-containing protein n=1 Tax=Tetragenococcus halophilus TaxID=51669 RepID=UPI0030C9BFD0
MVEISEERLEELENIEEKYKNKKSYYRPITKEEKLEKVDTSNVGGKIRYQKIQKDITSTKLSKLLGISRTTLLGYENGARKPDMEKKIKIAEILQVKVKDIDPWTIEKIEEVNEKANTNTNEFYESGEFSF